MNSIGGAADRNDQSQPAERFDVLISTDQNIEHQQNFSELDLAILVLIALRNDIDLLRPLMPRARDALGSLRPGELLTVGPCGPPSGSLAVRSIPT